MILTDKNQVEITKEVTETVDLIQLDTEIAHWKDVINQAQKDRDNALRDAEITEVELLISEASKLGIVEKVDEVTPVDGIINL